MLLIPYNISILAWIITRFEADNFCFHMTSYCFVILTSKVIMNKYVDMFYIESSTSSARDACD